ncbi:unnamed protein product [Brachionus calyciflorus]|uniref:Echinoderm microtubule-associated protein-like 6 n=1 Tax=Brachionus calyciflorus TaxID=104777 RepID=A0A813YUT3_9BILA|nr:unnamed protein product [Brachionus calyciflorus]
MDRTAPKCQLRLEWVYGYRGHQVRSNLFYNKNNEIIYFVAGVGIVQNHSEHKQRFFLGHDDDIISLTLHPDKTQVATGQVGKSPQILVWDSNTLQTTSILKGGHTDGIGILAFDKTGQKLASCGIDQDSTIIVWDWKKGKILAKSTGHQERVFDLQFNPYVENSLISCGVKQISFWNLIGNTLQKKKGLFGKTKDIQTMFTLAFGEQVQDGKDTKLICYTGTINGQIYVWKGNQLEEIIPDAHSGSVYSITKTEDGYLSSGKDGAVRKWDSKFSPLETIDLKYLITSKETPEFYCCDDELIVRSLYNKENRLLVGTQSSEIFELNLADFNVECVVKGHAEGELWSLAVSPINSNIFATASDDQTVRIWDSKTNKILKIAELEKKIRSCDFNNDQTHLACGLSDGTLVVLNIEDMKVIYNQKIRNEVLHEMKYSPCGKYLAVGSNENYVDVFQTPKYKRLNTCSGNSSFITHLDWSKDSKYIQTNSGDGFRLIYELPGCKQFTKSPEIKNIKWQTFTGVIGDEVAGIWEKYTNKTDVNASDANFDENCIVTGDDFGLVKLFRFPCLKKGSKFRKYVGHSSHVTNVRFTKDKTRVISIGGADHAIFQWRFLPEELAETKMSEKLSDVKASIIQEDIPNEYQAYMDSNSEDSDSELSGNEVDSDIEKEKEISYERTVYKEDLNVLKPKIKEEIRKTESKSTVKRQQRPDVSLNLEFVFGYRGYDCRDNVFFIHESGEIVYHVAALGIVYNKETQVQKFYDQHTDDILCLSLHPLKNFVATGQIGRDPPIHVWDISTMRTLSILKGEHYRGISSINFSSDGKKLASVGLDDNHSICVWDWVKGEKLATTRGHKDKIFCIKWNPHSVDKLVTVGVKHIKFWNQVGGGFTSNRGIFGNLSPVENMMCISFGKTPDICYTGSGTGSIFMWKENKLLKIIKAHEGPLFAIYAHEQSEAYVTGGKDGSIILWNSQFSQIHKYNLNKSSLSKKSNGVLLFDNPSIRAISLASKKILIGTKNGEIIDIDKDGVISIVVQGHGEGELWGLSPHPERLECCTISDDKTLRIWSLEPKKYYMLRGKVFDRPGRSCQYSPNGKLIAIGFKDGQVCVLKSDTLEIIEKVNHRNQEISDLKFSPVTGRYLAIGSHDNFIDIYNVDTKKRVGICKGASSYITHVEWDVEGKLLMSNSGAKEILYFEAPRGARLNIRQDDVDKIQWSTFTSVLGPKCEGIWPPYTDVTDVNTTCLTRDCKILATGDDFGLVKLFEFPCYGKFAKFKKYNGHSSHVTNVRWAVNDSKLLSVGGNDTSLMIWNNQAYGSDTSEVNETRPLSSSTKSVHTEMVMRNSRKGESDDSETDDEDDGYDSDVKREHDIDYNKSIFMQEIKRPSPETVMKMYNQVNTSDKNESAKPSRMVKTKFKRTKINKFKNSDLDPMTLVHIMSKMAAIGDSEQALDESTGLEFNVKKEINGLKLSHIHGYRGFDCRDNLFYINDGTCIVYHAAAAGIVYDIAKNEQSFYLQHTDDIISLAVNENPKFKNIVATGQIGKSPTIHIWNALTKETQSILSGSTNSQGICSLDFSSNGKLLVSVALDDNYTISVWRWKEGSLVASASGDVRPNRIFRAMFRPDSSTVFVSVGFKHVKFWSLAGSELIKRKGVLTDWNSTGKKLKKMPTMLSIGFGLENLSYTGSMGGDVFIWKDNVLIRTILRAHQGPIFSMYTSLFDGCIVSGAKEKSSPVKIWDKDMKKCLKELSLGSSSVVKSVCRIKNKIIVGTKSNDIFEIQEKTSNIQSIVIGHSEGELWGLATHPNKSIFVTGSYDTNIKLWDIKTRKIIRLFKTEYKIRCIDFSPNGEMLGVGTSDGEVILYKLSKSYDKLEKLDFNRQRKSCIRDIKFSPVKSYLAAGSEDSTIDFYEINSDGKINRISYCTQVPGPILQMDWSTDAQNIRVGTDNYKTIVYKVPSGNQELDDEIHDKVEWNQWTSIFGAEVIGIWPTNAAENFINCAHLATHSMKLATGDDDGEVKLYKFPCLEKDDSYQSYYGHSSNVANVKFLADNSHLISIGGDDLCVFVWECE